MNLPASKSRIAAFALLGLVIVCAGLIALGPVVVLHRADGWSVNLIVY